jgi:Raf kinase inhibitor-like YbhB/YbcL family protein
MPLNIADLKISSPDFADLGAIDEIFSADGKNQAPRLHVSGVSDGAVELAIIVHDPDAPLAHGFTHWILYGLPAKDGIVTREAEGVREGPNGVGSHQYAGPQPPVGHGTHHYYFWVYALDAAVRGRPTREEFLAGYADHILEQNRLVGTYSR